MRNDGPFPFGAKSTSCHIVRRACAVRMSTDLQLMCADGAACRRLDLRVEISESCGTSAGAEPADSNRKQPRTDRWRVYLQAAAEPGVLTAGNRRAIICADAGLLAHVRFYMSAHPCRLMNPQPHRLRRSSARARALLTCVEQQRFRVAFFMSTVISMNRQSLRPSVFLKQVCLFLSGL